MKTIAQGLLIAVAVGGLTACIIINLYMLVRYHGFRVDPVGAARRAAP